MRDDSEFRFTFGRPGPAARSRQRDEAPGRILVLGDFRGRGTGSNAAAPTVPMLHPVDVLGIDELMARLAPRIRLEPADPTEPATTIAIAAMDDFHPDALRDQVGDFTALQRCRDDGRDRSVSGEGDAETLARLLGEPRESGDDPPSTPVDRMIREIVAPHVAPAPDPGQHASDAACDRAIADRMRAILHHPAFQAVEATWRSLAWLVQNLDDGDEHEVVICDVTKAELCDDLRAVSGHLDEANLYRRIIAPEVEVHGARGWSLVIGDYAFGDSDEDVFLLRGLGAIAARVGSVFLAAADPAVVGFSPREARLDDALWAAPEVTLQTDWESLRRAPEAAGVGLAWPRALLRLPYGPGTDPIDAFPFDEMPGAPVHTSFLWGNPAHVCALMLVRRHAMATVSTPRDQLTLDGFPLSVHDHDGTRIMQPCAEVWLSERAIQGLVSRGLIPLCSHKDRAAISVATLQTLAGTGVSLRGD